MCGPGGSIGLVQYPTTVGDPGSNQSRQKERRELFLPKYHRAMFYSS